MGAAISGSGMSGTAVYGSVSYSSNKNMINAMKHRQSSTKKKKQLNYNPRELSAQLVRASKSRMASEVLVRARGKVGTLERCLATGQYNDNQVRVAIAHAKRMVKCARLKVGHLKEEERIQAKNKKSESAQKREKDREVKRRVEDKKKELQRQAAKKMRDMQKVQKQRQMELELQRRRKMNRIEEQKKIDDADIKYYQGNTGDEPVMQPIIYTGVIYVPQMIQLDEQIMRQIEEEARQEVEMASEASYTGGGAAMAGDVSASIDAAPVESVSIDVLV